jgi:DNA-binding transcriptional MerR regulator
MSESRNKPDDTCYSISELAREFNITTRTIRFYEDQGLLTPGRQGRNRVYDRRDRTRLKLALRGKRLGLSLSEIKEILELFDTSPTGEQKQLHYFLQTLDKHRSALEQQKNDLEAILTEIELAKRDCVNRLRILESERLQDSLAS